MNALLLNQSVIAGTIEVSQPRIYAIMNLAGNAGKCSAEEPALTRHYIWGPIQRGWFHFTEGLKTTIASIAKKIETKPP